MIAHYFKIAIRILLKYKVQSFFSILGLAISFACVSLAVYWSYYEETFDAFHRNADRIYKSKFENSRKEGIDYINLAPYLESSYPEVEKACCVTLRHTMVKENRLYFMMVTPSALDIFDFEWIEGNPNIISWNENQVAISDEFARKCFGDSSPIGTKIENENEWYEIKAVYKKWSKHSNFKFDLLGPFNKKHGHYLKHCYIMLDPHCDHKHFMEKLRNDTIRGVCDKPCFMKELIPLQSLHYIEPDAHKSVLKQANLQIKYVHLFSLVAILLSFCALLNYLTLFINRFANKGREIALRTVCGSSGWQLGVLLMVEYLLLLLGALLLSLVFMECVMNKFIEYSMIELNRFAIYSKCIVLLLFVIVLAVLLSAIPIFYFKKKTLHMQLEPASVSNGKNLFRETSICIQLFTSIFFIFCTAIMIKQVCFLLHADIGIERKGIAYMGIYYTWDKTAVKETVKQFPFVKDLQFVSKQLYPYESSSFSISVDRWDEKSNETAAFTTDCIRINDSIADFFCIRIKEGVHSFDMLNDNEILINEAFVKAMNVSNPIGKSIHFGFSSSKIVGIVSDFQAQKPNEPVAPTYFTKFDEKLSYLLAIKYDGDFPSFNNSFQERWKRSGFSPMYLLDAEGMFKEYIISEYNFLKLLSIVACITLLIALFGVYALILQECERYQKSIAIRKIFGAHVKDIMKMFFKQYLIQIAIAALFAFPLGYLLMKRWLENYSRQTSIGIEVFLGIFIGMSILVILCIGWHVWKVANENPATVLKKE